MASKVSTSTKEVSSLQAPPGQSLTGGRCTLQRLCKAHMQPRLIWPTAVPEDPPHSPCCPRSQPRGAHPLRTHPNANMKRNP